MKVASIDAALQDAERAIRRRYADSERKLETGLLLQDFDPDDIDILIAQARSEFEWSLETQRPELRARILAAFAADGGHA